MGVRTESNGEPAYRGARKQSLVISPDLDKLLEHEERSRRSYATTATPMGPDSEISTLLPGLPPPPRRNRHGSTALPRCSSAKKTDNISSVVGRDSVSVLSAPTPLSRSSNPYINPAPTAEELFLSSHDSARPAPRPSQQSIHINDQQQNASECPTKRCFKAQTLAKGGKFAASPILRMFASGTDHGPGRTSISHISEEGTGFAKSTVDVLEISSTTSMNNRDPTSHRMSVKPRHLDPNLDNQSSSLLFSLSTTQPMASPPATPKPVLSRHPSLLKKQSALNSPFKATNTKPATTNFLDEAERAELVRKSRKLARLFGETPNAEAVVNQAGLLPTVLVHGNKSDPQVLPPRPDGTNASSRRYSLPLRVDDMHSIDFSRARDSDANLGSPELCSNRPSSSPVDTTFQSNSPQRANSIRSNSLVSLTELSDDRSSSSVARRTSISSSNASTYLESERRRKRERLAKLYRFLGPRVPINLVLGTNDDGAASLPPRQQHIHDIGNSENRHNTLLKRRRSSSAIPSTWSDDIERLKADLDDKEKAIIVRRAQKMEKLFGVAPPLTLYNSRSASAPSSGSATPLLHAGDILSYTCTATKSKKQKESRSATPESSRQLLPRRSDSFASITRFDYRSAQTGKNGHSTFYNHFEHSLNSLNDIIDRDDKAALAEFHHSLHGDIVPHEQPTTITSGSHEEDGTATPTSSGHRSSISSLLPRSERHGIFPARTSMVSLDSEYSLALPPPMPQASSFQQRRKRAAKLTHFFGVDYKELFDDVLESLEGDMQLGQSDGVLRAEEVEDLLQKLCKLKHKRQTFW